MSQVIDHSYKWFQEVAPRDYYLENDLERAVMHNLELLFPDFIAFAFKQDLLHPGTGKGNAADLGMVKKDYSEWYVIEVELGKHTLSEVVKQIETFKHCVYNKSNSDYIFNGNPSRFDKSALEALVVSTPPLLMVIVNEDKEGWKKPLKKLGCKTCIFQIYNDFTGRRLYRLDGEHPFIATDFCNCKYEKGVSYIVKVLKREFLDGYNVKDREVINIEFNGVVNKWQRNDSGRDVFLVCESPLPPLDSLCYRYRLNYSTRSITVTTALTNPTKGKKRARISKRGGRSSSIPRAIEIPFFTFTKD